MTNAPPRIFCDTSFFYASLDPADTNHQRARSLAAAASASRLVTTWDVVSETITLLRYRKSFATALLFVEEIRPALLIVSYTDRVREEAVLVFREHGRRRRLSFCDAISFVVVTALLDHVPCLSFGEDFRALGLTVIR